MRERRVPVVFCATCGVTFSSRHSMTKLAVSYALSAPSVTRRAPATGLTRSIAASRSASPVARVATPPTTSPLRFSISAWPM